MGTNEDRLRILKMIEEGKLTAAEAAELLAALGEEEAAPRVSPVLSRKGKRQTLRIKVDEKDGDKVNVNLPLGLVKVFAGNGKLEKLIPDSAKMEMKGQGIDISAFQIDEMIDMVERGELDEKIVDVRTEDGTVVEVYVE
jgi:soluble cytochrome b562